MGNLRYDFNGRRVVVTGGTSGIGRAISEGFLRAGAYVTSIFASNNSKAEAFAKDNNQYGRLKVIQLDVSDYQAVENFFNQMNEQGESLDILVNCAGIRRDSVLGMMRKEDWDRVIDVNLNGTFNMCKFALMKMMENRYGRIINVISPSGKYGFAGQANYAASKAAQEALCRALSKELARKNITVNCVSPGFIETDFISDLSKELKAKYIEQIPIKRFGQVEEVVPVVLFLASEEAGYITGATYEVTGGL